MIWTCLKFDSYIYFYLWLKGTSNTHLYYFFTGRLLLNVGYVKKKKITLNFLFLFLIEIQLTKTK